MKIRHVAGLAVAAALGLVPAGGAAGPVTFTDAVGDSGTAPDLTSVVVSNDTGGVVTFKVSIANRAALESDEQLLILIDADRTATTGDENGFEYLAGLGAGGSGIRKWDGSNYAEYTHGAVSGAYSAGVATVSFRNADVGAPKAFDFVVLALKGTDPAAITFDGAPENGVFTYTVQQAAKVDSADARFSPTVPRAGKLFAVTGVKVFLTDKTSARASSFACTAKLAGKKLPPLARCRWRLPATSRGKKLVVSVSLRYRAESGRITPYTFKVR